MYWIYSTYSLILTVSDAKQHLKMFWSDCLKERQEFMIKFQFTMNIIYEITIKPQKCSEIFIP